MKTSPAGRKLIESFEGLILEAYDDANDKIVPLGGRVFGTLTIGYGHTNAAGPPEVFIGQKITSVQADQILSEDLGLVEKDVESLVKVALNQNQLDALVSFQFNTGWLGHPHCSLLDAVNAGKTKTAAADFMLYDRAKGVVLAGLDRRRAAEKALFETPTTENVQMPTAPPAVSTANTGTAAAAASKGQPFQFPTINVVEIEKAIATLSTILPIVATFFPPLRIALPFLPIAQGLLEMIAEIEAAMAAGGDVTAVIASHLEKLAAQVRTTSTST